MCYGIYVRARSRTIHRVHANVISHAFVSVRLVSRPLRASRHKNAKLRRADGLIIAGMLLAMAAMAVARVTYMRLFRVLEIGLSSSVFVPVVLSRKASRVTSPRRVDEGARLISSRLILRTYRNSRAIARNLTTTEGRGVRRATIATHRPVVDRVFFSERRQERRGVKGACSETKRKGRTGGRNRVKTNARAIRAPSHFCLIVDSICDS